MVFRKKNKKKKDKIDNSSHQEDVKKMSNVGKKRKKNDQLSSVVHESTPGAAIELMENNEPFVLPNNSGYLVLLLKTDSEKFGGLSQKTKRDEDKGSIIELIAGDELQVVATEEMLKDNILGFIPNELTRKRMDEFRILREADLYWGVITYSGGKITCTVVDHGSFTQAQDIAAERDSISNILPHVFEWTHITNRSDSPPVAGEKPQRKEAEPQKVEENNENVQRTSVMKEPQVKETPEAVNEPQVEPGGETHEVVSGEQHPFNDAPKATEDTTPAEVAQEEPVPATTTPVEESEKAVDQPIADDDYSDEGWNGEDDFDGAIDEEDSVDESEMYDEETDPESDAYVQYVTRNYGRDIDQATVRNSIIRRFQVDNLDSLDVDLDVFAKKFDIDAPPPSIEVPETNDSGWLSDYISAYARQANAQLAMLYNNHLSELREAYEGILSHHIEDFIEHKLDISSPGSKSDFKVMLEKIDQQKRDYESKMSDQISQRQKDIENRYREQANAHAERIRQEAYDQYMQDVRGTREREMSNVEISISNELDSARNEARAAILERRSAHAKALYDKGLTKTLVLLQDIREQQRVQEAKLLEEWTGKINEAIDINRKEDIARIEALQEQQAREDTTAKLMEQFAHERKQMAVEREQRISELKDAMELEHQRLIDDHQHDVSGLRRQLDDERTRADQAKELVDGLTRQLGEVSETFEKQYRHRIEDLEHDKRSYSEELERAGQARKRDSITYLIQVVVLLIIGLLAGLVLGRGTHPGHAVGAQDSPTITQVVEYETTPHSVVLG